jgi:hypothetical protein
MGDVLVLSALYHVSALAMADPCMATPASVRVAAASQPWPEGISVNSVLWAGRTVMFLLSQMVLSMKDVSLYKVGTVHVTDCLHIDAQGTEGCQ